MTRRGHHESAATRAKISAALKGKTYKRVAGVKRKPMSEATKRKLSLERKGKPHPHKGHPMSAATRAKISASLKGKHHSRRSNRTPRIRSRPQHAAYGKTATRFRRARRQVEHARRHHARFQLQRAHRHSVRHQRSRNYKVRIGKRSGRRR